MVANNRETQTLVSKRALKQSQQLRNLAPRCFTGNESSRLSQVVCSTNSKKETPWWQLKIHAVQRENAYQSEQIAWLQGCNLHLPHCSTRKEMAMRVESVHFWFCKKNSLFNLKPQAWKILRESVTKYLFNPKKIFFIWKQKCFKKLNCKVLFRPQKGIFEPKEKRETNERKETERATRTKKLTQSKGGVWYLCVHWTDHRGGWSHVIVWNGQRLVTRTARRSRWSHGWSVRWSQLMDCPHCRRAGGHPYCLQRPGCGQTAAGNLSSITKLDFAGHTSLSDKEHPQNDRRVQTTSCLHTHHDASILVSFWGHVHTASIHDHRRDSVCIAGHVHIASILGLHCGGGAAPSVFPVSGTNLCLVSPLM